MAHNDPTTGVQLKDTTDQPFPLSTWLNSTLNTIIAWMLLRAGYTYVWTASSGTGSRASQTGMREGDTGYDRTNHTAYTYSSAGAWVTTYSQIQPATITFTPVIGGVTIGNGTLLGRSMNLGNANYDIMDWLMGSTDSVTGSITIQPSIPVGSTFDDVAIIDAYAIHSSVRYPLRARFTSSSTITIAAINTAGTYAVDAATSATVPFTWAAGDELRVGVLYRTA